MSTDLTDVGILALCLALSAAIIMVARFSKFMRASVGGMKVELGQVNKAVNHVQPGEPTLLQQVRDLGGMMKEHMDKADARFEDLGGRVDALGTKVDVITWRFEEHVKSLQTAEHSVSA